MHVLITGASSGIGAALALRYARDGALLSLIGRNAARLDAIATACRAQGASVDRATIDVRDRDALQRWVQDRDAASPIDVLIANAGVTGGTSAGGALEAADDALRLWNINVGGMMHAVHAILPRMDARGSGQIALMSSLAAFVPLPDAPSYSASKAAALHYGLALREGVQRRGLRVSVICPGYVDTPLSARLSGAKPNMIGADRAAATIHDGLARNQRIIAFPQPIATITRLLAFLPARWTRATVPSFHVTPPHDG